MVTVETAITLTVVIAVLALALGGLSLVRQQADLCHAAREAARAHSVGEDASAAYTAMPGASVSATQTGTMVTVTASRTVAAWPWDLECQATTRLEFAGGNP